MPLIETGDDWPEEIIRAAREDELAIFVGNGLTRLSNGPSWGDIFDRKDVQEFLENNNLDRSNLLYSELADILERREQSIWRNIRIKLRDDCGRLTHNSCHQVLKHIIIRSDSSKKRVVTTNIDSLLDDVGFAKTILRLHGSNDRIDDWVFTYSKYVEHAGRIQDAFSHVRAQFILFVGYGIPQRMST